MQILKFYDDVYMVNYRVVYDCTVGEFYECIKQETNEVITQEGTHPWNSLCECLELGRKFDVFLLLNKGDVNLRGLAHEIAHAVVRVFEVRGIPINEECDEAFCWYYDYLLNKFYVQLQGIENEEKV